MRSRESVVVGANVPARVSISALSLLLLLLLLETPDARMVDGKRVAYCA